MTSSGPLSVELRTMTSEEFPAWRAHSIEGFALEVARGRAISVEAARVQGEKGFEAMLPNGLESDGARVFVAVAGGASVGTLWLVFNDRDGVKRTFVADVEIFEEFRGRGFGRAIMRAAEDQARAFGSWAIELHVFGWNAHARRLYESLGYEATSVDMRKVLQPKDDLDK